MAEIHASLQSQHFRFYIHVGLLLTCISLFACLKIFSVMQVVHTLAKAQTSTLFGSQKPL